MSASIAISANLTKDKLKKALNEIKQLEVIRPDLPVENQCEQCKEQERKLKEKQITTLGRINEKWLEFLQRVPAKQKEENQRYATMVEDDQGILKLSENVEQTSIELTIQEKLPRWVLDEVYKRKELDPDWSVTDRNIQTKYNVLLLCREVAVVNPQKLGIKAKVLAFFDIGSQLSFMSKNLANQLRIKGKSEILHLAGFRKERLIEFQTMKTVVGIRLSNEETIQMEVSTVDHLTNDLQVADLPDQNLEQIKELHVETKVGPIVAGYGQINNVNSNITQVETAIVCATIRRNVPGIDQFWKLELIGVKEEPETTDDDKASSQFKRSVSKYNGRYQVSWPWKETTTPQLLLIQQQFIYQLKDGNERKTSLIFSKVRLAPIKVITVPRLELMGALIGPKFIQNRVEEIRKSKFSFRYVPSRTNPAARGIKPEDLKYQKLWWNGPHWLNE
uniref:Bm10904 n=1 Tax=Brugia malayi TaxID=6279 RepID=A0A1I9G4Q3_BRUMA|nr:Bm10904 [Brugia malayi]